MLTFYSRQWVFCVLFSSSFSNLFLGSMKPVNIWHHQSQLDRSPYFDWAGFCVRAAAPVRCTAEGDPTTSRSAADCIHQPLPPHSRPHLPQSQHHKHSQFWLRPVLCCHSLLNCIVFLFVSLCINTCFGCCVTGVSTSSDCSPCLCPVSGQPVQSLHLCARMSGLTRFSTPVFHLGATDHRLGCAVQSAVECRGSPLSKLMVVLAGRLI